MQYTVYILKSLRSGRYYVGQTYDLNKRLAEHNSELAGHTLKEQPWQVCWSMQLDTRAEAMQMEKKIKKRGANRFLQDMEAR